MKKNYQMINNYGGRSKIYHSRCRQVVRNHKTVFKRSKSLKWWMHNWRLGTQQLLKINLGFKVLGSKWLGVWRAELVSVRLSNPWNWNSVICFLAGWFFFLAFNIFEIVSSFYPRLLCCATADDENIIKVIVYKVWSNEKSSPSFQNLVSCDYLHPLPS